MLLFWSSISGTILQRNARIQFNKMYNVFINNKYMMECFHLQYY